MVLLVFVFAVVTWIMATVVFTGPGWVYEHVGALCLAAGVVFAFTLVGIVLMWELRPTGESDRSRGADSDGDGRRASGDIHAGNRRQSEQ